MSIKVDVPGKSLVMQKLLFVPEVVNESVKSIANSKSPLIAVVGNKASGKSTVMNSIHEASRERKPLVQKPVKPRLTDTEALLKGVFPNYSFEQIYNIRDNFLTVEERKSFDEGFLIIDATGVESKNKKKKAFQKVKKKVKHLLNENNPILNNSRSKWKKKMDLSMDKVVVRIEFEKLKPKDFSYKAIMEQVELKIVRETFNSIYVNYGYLQYKIKDRYIKFSEESLSFTKRYMFEENFEAGFTPGTYLQATLEFLESECIEIGAVIVEDIDRVHYFGHDVSLIIESFLRYFPKAIVSFSDPSYTLKGKVLNRRGYDVVEVNCGLNIENITNIIKKRIEYENLGLSPQNQYYNFDLFNEELVGMIIYYCKDNINASLSVAKRLAESVKVYRGPINEYKNIEKLIISALTLYSIGYHDRSTLSTVNNYLRKHRY